MAEAIAVLEVVSGTTSLAAILANMASKLWNAAEAIKIINEETKFVKSEVTDLVPVLKMIGTVINRLPDTSEDAGVSMTNALRIDSVDIQSFLDNLTAIHKELGEYINSKMTSKYLDFFKALIPNRRKTRLQVLTDRLNSTKAILNLSLTALNCSLQVVETLKKPKKPKATNHLSENDLDPIDRSMIKKFTDELSKHNKKLSGLHCKRKNKTPQSDASPSSSSVPTSVKTELRGSVEHFEAAGESLDFDAVSETSRNSVDDSCSFPDIRTDAPDHQSKQEVDSATNDDIAHREDVSDASYASDVLEGILAEPSLNAEDPDGVTQMPNQMESPDNPEECGHAIVGASSDLIRCVSVGIEEDYICEVCQGSLKTCDCSLRHLIKWKRDTSVLEELIYPSYLFFPPFYFGGKGIEGVVPDVRQKTRNMPRWSWRPEQELGLFHFAIEHHQQFSMAGWTPTLVPAGSGYAGFVDMLAGSGERREFVEPPVKEVVPSPVLPPG